MRLDRTDGEILKILVADGRASFSRIGAEVGLSPHGAADRIRRLRKAGVITAFTAIVNPGQMGRGLAAYIDVRLMPTVTPDAFEQRTRRIAAIEEMAFVTGRFDYQVRVSCTDSDELDQVVRELRQAAGAAQTETRIVMRRANRQ